MSSIFVERKDGTIYDLDALGFKVLTFDPPATNWTHTYQQQGRYGTTLVDTKADSLSIPLSLVITAHDVYDLELQRLELKRILDSSETFYVYSDRIPYLRWEVVADSFQFPQTSNFWRATASINLVCPTGFAESRATTLDSLTYGTDLWGMGMNLPNGQDLRYTFQNERTCNVYNASNIDLLADDKPVQIIFNGNVANKLTIANYTTGQVFEYTRPLTTANTLILNGLIPIEDDAQMYYASNHSYIDFKKGWNKIGIDGATDFKISFKTRFYY
ncbi:MAG TPA: phage tail family protein [Lactobacillus sp.]|uniref:phage tail domain-containing protein n=1 Tax=Ligilactobacillus murinus TaxID=1622 RepID=UPI00096C07F0|nr:phage tail domain-containing protein [Ligilactobacillus murinus]ASD50635.1 holin-like putative tail component protein [Lactobacillus phage phiEF-1.1]HAP23565.1 phage tail family protein [Lactobacillus sp.]